MNRETSRAIASLTPVSLQEEQLVVLMAKYFSKITRHRSKQTLSQAIKEFEEKIDSGDILKVEQHVRRQ